MSNQKDPNAQDDLIYADERNALRSIINSAAENLTKISESAFKARFLPMFAAEGMVDVRYWLEISGHPHKPFQVMDDKTGDLLFVVPPLLNTGRVPSRLPGAMSYGDLIGRFEQIRTSNPMEANRMLASELEYRNEHYNKQNLYDDQVNIDRWKFIVDRYNLKVAWNETLSKTTSGASSTGSSIVSEEADDF